MGGIHASRKVGNPMMMVSSAASTILLMNQLAGAAVAAATKIVVKSTSSAKIVSQKKKWRGSVQMVWAILRQRDGMGSFIEIRRKKLRVYDYYVARRSVA